MNTLQVQRIFAKIAKKLAQELKTTCLVCGLLILSGVIFTFPSLTTADNQGWGPISTPAVRDRIARRLQEYPFSKANVGIHIVSLRTGRTWYSHNARKLFVPASNMKIITAAAALRTLKPEFRFRTEIYADGKISNGRLDGNLYLKGGGDPTLVDETLYLMARDINYDGIREITGRVLADDTLFDSKRYGPGWDKSEVKAYGAPLGAPNRCLQTS